MWHKDSGISYDEHCRRAVDAAVARGHGDLANLREILTWTTNMTTAPIAEAYLAAHRGDAKLLRSLVDLALDNADGFDWSWAAANTIADYPGTMLLPHKASLEQLAREELAYLHVPSQRALAKIAAVGSAT